MEQFRSIYRSIMDFLQHPVFTLGKEDVTLASLLYLVVSLILLFYLSAKLRNLLQNRILARYNIDIGVRQAISTIIRYIILVVGLAIIIQSAGIDLSFLAILAGALGVGIGFGLQNITNNFVSGLVILFERPVKVGDRIELTNPAGETINGDVINISARASTILTNDNIAVIVPNSNLISSTVINWSYNDRKVRFRFPIGVHYKEDPEKVRKLLVEVAMENDGVLKTPPPDVQFFEFGDSSLNFLLRVWTTKYIHRPGFLKSQINFAIHKKFKEHHIEIPYPQRDLHLRSGFEPLHNKSTGD
jgi:small-conductance mechanosensitive channel